ncbi:MAG: PaaI family thioesterase [Alphaproteobacteria bacterium]
MGQLISPAPLFAAHLPIEVLERDVGRLVTATTFTDQHVNAVGAVHGGMIAAVLDVALAGGGSATGNAEDYGITLSITVNFVRPLSPGRTTCESVMVGGGRRTKFAEAKLRDGAGVLVATASGTVQVIQRPSPDTGPLTAR